ncbi:MAG: hypothetical protein JWO30_1778 [Fibrobacteres bacterium]|nr:hypothetical protein [Fibrobacterota bacterium]
MIPKPNYQYIALGLLAGLLILHWLWCHFIAFPISFEKKLKRGKPWVYIPIRWKGSYKFQIVLVTRILMLALVAVSVALLRDFTHKTEAPWILLYTLAVGFLVLRLNSLWLDFRYRQQEDSYYFLHDELRAKLEGEGKDMAESAFKSLAAYQHQNLLRKADEGGTLIKTLKNQAKISRKYRKEVRTRETVET